MINNYFIRYRGSVLVKWFLFFNFFIFQCLEVQPYILIACTVLVIEILRVCPGPVSRKFNYDNNSLIESLSQSYLVHFHWYTLFYSINYIPTFVGGCVYGMCTSAAVPTYLNRLKKLQQINRIVGSRRIRFNHSHILEFSDIFISDLNWIE